MFDWLFGKEEQVEEVEEIIRKEFVVLVILDGFGVHPDREGNSVLQANTPFLDRAWTFGKSTLIHASGSHVGLPMDEPGNSEVGHLNIGSGQVVYQSLQRINDTIAANELVDNEVIQEIFKTVKERKTNLHLMGILSAGGVHGHIEHLFALLDICKQQGVSPLIHAMLDGRDTPPTDGYFYISKLVQKLKELGIGQIASVSGRLYSMDRDSRWERTQLAYNAMMGLGQRKAFDVFSLIQEAYKNNETDQIFLPTTMVDQNGNPIGPIKNGDVVLFYNFREDRARQMTKVFMLDEFNGFPRVNFPENLYFATMTGYSDDLKTHIVFPPKKITETLASVLSDNQLNQFHISETEKYMHVSYFFNGGVEAPHAGEDFFNIPSPKVFDYSTTPEMSAEITKDEVLYRLDNMHKKKYSFIVINFANPDMLGHTGNLAQAIKANEFVDKCTQEIAQKAVAKGGAVVIIADHGNCETMIDRITKKIDTQHNPNPVPFILVHDINQIDMGRPAKVLKIGTGERAQPTGILSDVAPTILNILGIEPPSTMTGVNLIDII
ncbi:MAG TPA: 2,3-bisphosphoglycerate-independent phosphoglycerate mutase [Candidatus Dojkabacteria bacterium]|nr:2,3-bisphosphoglycerate-independent phosphoglycerate mutase [Candidatus Dojkabacteria bacterium]